MNCVVFITASGIREAKAISRALVKEHLAACVNAVKGVDSVFVWSNKVDRAREVLLIAKTSRRRLPQLIKRVRSLHSYDCPEIIALPVVAGDQRYLEWLNESVR